MLYIHNPYSFFESKCEYRKTTERRNDGEISNSDMVRRPPLFADESNRANIRVVTFTKSCWACGVSIHYATFKCIACMCVISRCNKCKYCTCGCTPGVPREPHVYEKDSVTKITVSSVRPCNDKTPQRSQKLAAALAKTRQ